MTNGVSSLFLAFFVISSIIYSQESFGVYQGTDGEKKARILNYYENEPPDP